MSAITLLRSRTADAHDAVDAAYGRFDLTHADDYRRFLLAHARALPTGEVMAAAVWPGLRARTPALLGDLAALGVALDGTGHADAAEGAAAWGALYVVEGSRLGGGMLAKQVGEGLPRAYLSAVHEPGEWRAIRAAVDAASAGQDQAWHEAMVAGALAVFDRYRAAAVDPEPGA